MIKRGSDRGRLYFFAIGLLCVFALIIFISESESTIKPERIPDVVDFNFHIRPILSDRCFKCHGPDANQRKADLRLDTKEGLYQTLKDDPEGHIVIPGESKDSELYRRVTQEDTSLVMPPPNSKLSLTDYEKRLIKKWIEQGAQYQKHWAFIPPEKKGAARFGE